MERKGSIPIAVIFIAALAITIFGIAAMIATDKSLVDLLLETFKFLSLKLVFNVGDVVF